MTLNTTLSHKAIVNLAASYLLKRLLEEKKKGTKSTNMPELVGSTWDEELTPYYEMYGKSKTAGHQLGKVLKKQADFLGIRSQVETRRGGKQITRYFF